MSMDAIQDTVINHISTAQQYAVDTTKTLRGHVYNFLPEAPDAFRTLYANDPTGIAKLYFPAALGAFTGMFLVPTVANCLSLRLRKAVPFALVTAAAAGAAAAASTTNESLRNTVAGVAAGAVIAIVKRVLTK